MRMYRVGYTKIEFVTVGDIPVKHPDFLYTVSKVCVKTTSTDSSIKRLFNSYFIFQKLNLRSLYGHICRVDSEKLYHYIGIPNDSL